jgi:hypothetical protein
VRLLYETCILMPNPITPKCFGYIKLITDDSKVTQTLELFTEMIKMGRIRKRDQNQFR